MSTMNISLPGALKSFVDEQVARHGYGSTSEYVRELIRRDLDRSRLRDLLLTGTSTQAVAEIDDAFFDTLRDRARQPTDG